MQELLFQSMDFPGRSCIANHDIYITAAQSKQTISSDWQVISAWGHNLGTA